MKTKNAETLGAVHTCNIIKAEKLYIKYKDMKINMLLIHRQTVF